MAERRTEDVGSLGKNKRKERESHPSHAGSCRVGGKDYWISAFVNEDRETGERYFKLYFKAREARARTVAAGEKPDDLEGPDIPF